MNARARLLSGIGIEVAGLALVTVPGTGPAFWLGLAALTLGAVLACSALVR